jgi:hypothetical protein
MKNEDQILLEQAYNRIHESEPGEEGSDLETVSNFDDARYLESIANELFDIGARINSGNIRPEDGDYLQEVAGDVESLAAKLSKMRDY